MAMSTSAQKLGSSSPALNVCLYRLCSAALTGLPNSIISQTPKVVVSTGTTRSPSTLVLPSKGSAGLRVPRRVAAVFLLRLMTRASVLKGIFQPLGSAGSSPKVVSGPMSIWPR